jgi:hypothetical protein
MKKQKKIEWCNTIVLYDMDITDQTFKDYFQSMEKWAEDVQIPWESIGLTTSQKLILFKNGKKKLEKTDFQGIEDIELLGGVSEPGTHLNWESYSCLNSKRKGEFVLSFLDTKLGFSKALLLPIIQEILTFSQPRYGIIYQRDYENGPHLYASGCNSGLGYSDEELVERRKITSWSDEYDFDDGKYRTGLLRDVYPFNILVHTHLTEPVGGRTLEAWIDSNPRHGVLDKITNSHWLWSVDPEHIPLAQEALQEAGLLLCYKV